MVSFRSFGGDFRANFRRNETPFLPPYRTFVDSNQSFVSFSGFRDQVWSPPVAFFGGFTDEDVFGSGDQVPEDVFLGSTKSYFTRRRG